MTTCQAIGMGTDFGGESANDLPRVHMAAYIWDSIASVGCKCKNNQWTVLFPQVDYLSPVMRNIANTSSRQRKQFSLASGENRVQVDGLWCEE